MVKVPYESIGLILANEVGFWNTYEKREQFYLTEFEKLEHGILGKYINDFYSSVWIKDDQTYREFGETYQVVSGGWYGTNKEGQWVGGRWNTIKRKFGELEFVGVTNFEQQKPASDTGLKFIIKKPRFTNRLGLEISNKSIGSISFLCDNISFKPLPGLFLFDVKKDRFVVSTNILNENGLCLIEE